MTLTDKWRNGELEQGYYYTRYTPSVGKPFVEIELRSYLIDLAKIRDADTVEVLAPVPSYDEYLESESHCAVYSIANKSLEKENQQLRELLEECRHIMNIEKDFASCHFEKQKLDELLTKIDNAIGEK